MHTPLILLHFGSTEAKYLSDFISVAKQYGNYVIFIGDDSNKQLVSHLVDEFHYLDDYRTSVNHKYIEKRKQLNIESKSKTGKEGTQVQMFCVEKFIILKNFLDSRSDIDVLWVLDSDVMVFHNLTKLYIENYNEYDCMKHFGVGIQGMVKKEVLNLFYDYICRDDFQQVKPFHSDMEVGGSFLATQRNNLNILSADTAILDNKVFDKCLCITKSRQLWDSQLDFEKEEKSIISFNFRDIKRIYVKDKQFYFKLNNEYINIVNLNLSWVRDKFIRHFTDYILKQDMSIFEYKGVLKYE